MQKREKGITITRQGDTYMVRRCKRISTYDILWDKKLDNNCYQLFPVSLPGNVTMFLELGTRRLYDKSAKIECINRHHVTYIRDRNYRYRKYKLGKSGFQKILLKDHYFQQRMALPRLRTYSPKLLHYENSRRKMYCLNQTYVLR